MGHLGVLLEPVRAEMEEQPISCHLERIFPSRVRQLSPSFLSLLAGEIYATETYFHLPDFRSANLESATENATRVLFTDPSDSR